MFDGDPWGYGPDFDERCYLLTLEAENQGEDDSGRDALPDLESLAPGPFLAVILAHADRSRLNGYQLVGLLRARERMVAHLQAESLADVHEIAYAEAADAGSDPQRRAEAFEFAADELRPALCLSRRAAEARMELAFDLRERLPRVWTMMDQGSIDLPRARVFADGTAHLTETNAQRIVDLLADEAPRLTTGQLKARIHRLCIDIDPEDARRRYETAVEARSFVLEPTQSGTANLHLLDIPCSDARAIGRRVNAIMISLRRDGDTRSHDSLRADIAIDLLLGDAKSNGRGLVDIRVDLTTLTGLDDRAAEIPGMGPVIADIARQVADRQHRAEWRAVVTDGQGHVVDIVTTRRRPTSAISRHTTALQPTCSFPGCRAPASDCDYDHLLPWRVGGPTSVSNGGPKCRHDHILKDHGWTHRRSNEEDTWTSPLGRTYITQGQSP